MKALWALGCLCVSGVAFAESGYEWETVITLESVFNLEGGVKTGSRDLANLDVTLGIDTEKVGWWKNGEWFFYVLGDYGRDPGELTGDWQGVSNIAADKSIKVYEFWYQHSFAENSVKVLLGLHDYNSSFYSLDSAGLFSHPSFGIGPDTSQVTPSIFPTTSMALQFSYEVESLYVLTAIYDGVPGNPDNPRGTHIRFDHGDGVFLAFESGIVEVDKYKFGIGAWQHTAEFESPITGELESNNKGLYLIAEKYWSSDVATFVQIGHADDEVNQVEGYFGSGVVVSNIFREDDSMGLAVASARNGDSYLNSSSSSLRAETAWEFSFFYPAAHWLSLQSSIYYFKHPSMDQALESAKAIGLRAYIQW